MDDCKSRLCYGCCRNISEVVSRTYSTYHVAPVQLYNDVSLLPVCGVSAKSLVVCSHTYQFTVKR